MAAVCCFLLVASTELRMHAMRVPRSQCASSSGRRLPGDSVVTVPKHSAVLTHLVNFT